MKSLSSTLGRLAVILSGTLALGACSRANYATLPRTDAYLNTPTAVAKPRAVAAPAAPVASSPTAETPVTPTVAATPKPAAAATATANAPVIASRPASATAPATIATTPAPKLNLVQRLALHKITKKLDKLAAKAPALRQHDATAARGGLDSNLRYAIIFGVIGLLLTLLGGVAGIFYVLGIISIVVGLVFLLFWVLDQA